MNLKELIKQYNPNDEQQLKEKKYFLNWLDSFEDVLTRENEFGHFASSALIINKDRTKFLSVYHNLYDSWIYPGGHADGEEDLLSVAVRETEEETGIKIIKQLKDGIFDLQADPIKGQFKKGKFISAHIHLNVIFLFEADDSLPLKVKEDENSGVRWIPIEECVENANDYFMKEIYTRLVSKIKNL